MRSIRIRFVLFFFVLLQVLGENWQKVLHPKFLKLHHVSLDDLDSKDLRQEVDWSVDSDPKLHLNCYLYSEKSFDEHIPVYYDKKTNTACSLIENNQETNQQTSELGPYPAMLKVDSDIFEYFENKESWARRKLKEEKKEPIKPEEIPLRLSIQFNPLRAKKLTPRSLANNIYQKMSQKLRTSSLFKLSLLESKVTRPVISLASKILHTSKNPHATPKITVDHYLNCSNLIEHELIITSNGFELLNIEQLDEECLMSYILYLAGSSSVLSISISSSPQLMNYEARGRMQSGKVEVEPYHEAGLTGQGQVCGIADSGLYDLSCFFVDDSNVYPTVLTSRTGIIEPFRRKVIQYIPYADTLDDLGGHGTHVSGAVAGSSLSEFGKLDGLARDSKISFFDLGITSKPFLKVPAVAEVYQTAYDAGARIHTNSWGNIGGIYGTMTYDSDLYTYENDDFLLLFAAGNSGANGMHTINAPANAKNVLTVGAGQLRSVFDDKAFPEEKYAIAMFSSIGPTFDGRIKPDIIAPGDFIESAYANEPNNLTAAFGTNWKGTDTCAVHQMSGTSMATPLAAGAALLIRQYFMQSGFWASLCNPLYLTCSQGPFHPSGYFMKAMILHSGTPIYRYSDPDYDTEGGFFNSFPLESPPDVFQGYGEILMKNILPLSKGKGLPSNLDLVIWDKLEIPEFSTIKLTVTMINPVSAESPFKISLCWYDPPHAVGYATKLLLHDLDLIIQGPRGEYYLGNKAKQSFSLEDIQTGVVSLDEHNPNEQISLFSSSCIEDNKGPCIYTIYIQSYSLPISEIKRQKFALVITTNGTVSEPELLKDSLIIDLKASSPVIIHQEPPILSEHSLEVSLFGGESSHEIYNLTYCTLLSAITVELQFTNHGGADNWPYNLELTVVDPIGKGLALGGVDSSVGKAKIITEWPDEWMTRRNGSYRAHLGVKDAQLHGQGPWHLYLMNSWSQSGLANYNISVTFEFEGLGGNDTCIDENTDDALVPTPQPVLFPPFIHNNSKLILPNGKDYSSQLVSFENIPLGVHNDNGTLVQDRVVLGTFTHEGILDNILLSVNGIENDKTTRGTNSWLLTVVVRAPNGLTLQVGGFEWFSTADRFYGRRWPDPWLLKDSGGINWVAVRDVHAGQLSSIPNTSIPSQKPSKDHRSLYTVKIPKSNSHNTSIGNLWTIELGMGYVFGTRPQVPFSGHIELYFTPIIPTTPTKDEKTPVISPSHSPSHFPTINNNISKISTSNLSYTQICIALIILFSSGIGLYLVYINKTSGPLMMSRVLARREASYDRIRDDDDDDDLIAKPSANSNFNSIELSRLEPSTYQGSYGNV